jgi:probable HAF family extracellular repeat protein
MKFNKLALCFVLLLAASTCFAQMYTVTDLGTLGGSWSMATGVNNLGQVTGRSEVLNSYGLLRAHAFLWTKNGGMQDLGTLPDSYNDFLFSSGGQAVNDLGLVAGSSWWSRSQDHAFIWSRNSGIQDLGTPPGLYGDTHAHGINIFGQVVGAAAEITGGAYPHAFLWTKAGGMQTLGNLPGGLYSAAYGINNLGQVVGAAGTNIPEVLEYELTHAFLWTKRNGMEDLGQWHAVAINNFGKIVGGGGYWSGTYPGVAVSWTRSQGLQPLDSLPGATSSQASAINDFGQIVGTTNSDPYTSHATLWSPRSGVWDLNNLISPNSGWVLYEATGINAWGQIVGNGTLNGQNHGFLLTPNLP